MCQGAGDSGNAPMGKSMGLKDLGSVEVQSASDAVLVALIANGKGKMPTYKAKLSDSDILDLLKCIRTLRKKECEPIDPGICSVFTGLEIQDKYCPFVAIVGEKPGQPGSRRLGRREREYGKQLSIAQANCKIDAYSLEHLSRSTFTYA